jgi:hypothetical protein
MVVGGWIWACGSTTHEERNELTARCAGIYLLIGVRATGNLEGDEWTRRANYICFSGYLSQPHQIMVLRRSGGALILKPLLLHASSKARVAVHRRVLHFVFGPQALPLGLEWPYAI